MWPAQYTILFHFLGLSPRHDMYYNKHLVLFRFCSVVDEFSHGVNGKRVSVSAPLQAVVHYVGWTDLWDVTHKNMPSRFLRVTS